MKHSLFYILLLFSVYAFSQIAVTNAEALAMTTASAGDMYLNTDNNKLYIGLPDGSLRTINFGNESGIGITGTNEGDEITWDTVTEAWIPSVSGTVSSPIRAVTGVVTLTETDYTIILKAGTYADPGLILPAADLSTGRIYLIKNISGVVVNFNIPFVYTNGISYTGLPTNYTIIVQSDGTNWQVISTNY